MVASVSSLPLPRDPRGPLAPIGRTFFHPLVDYALVGGGLSLVFCVAAALGKISLDSQQTLVAFIFFNYAHFAASTVRLYTRPGVLQELPGVALATPLAAIAITTAVIATQQRTGDYLVATYLSWSAYHYSAQAYGLGLMYAYRSECRVTDVERRALWIACLMTAVNSVSHARGPLLLLVPSGFFASHPLADHARALVHGTAGVLAFVVPLGLMASLRRSGRRLPLISWLLVLTNACWWVLFAERAMFWVTVFHSVQYLAIISIFYARDEQRKPENKHGVAFHVVAFYVVCIALGYALFELAPVFYREIGFWHPRTALLVAASVNIHHFFVDGFIWKLRRGDTYRTVVGPAVA